MSNTSVKTKKEPAPPWDKRYIKREREIAAFHCEQNRNAWELIFGIGLGMLEDMRYPESYEYGAEWAYLCGEVELADVLTGRMTSRERLDFLHEKLTALLDYWQPFRAKHPQTFPESGFNWIKTLTFEFRP